MRHVLTVSAAVLAASLSLASAQVRSQSIVVSPLPVAAPVAHLPAALTDLVRRGGSITLTDAQGHTVATVGPDGAVKLSAGKTLGNATAVSVKVGNATTYPLAARVEGSGHLLVTRKNANGRTQVVPLVAAVSSTHDNGKKADGKKDGQQEQDGEGDQGGQHGNAGHPGQPGHGNGHR